SADVIDGTTTTNIEPGDIAQSDDGSYGHIGFVTTVTKDANGAVTSFKTAEMNKSGDGNYTGPDVNVYDTRDAAGKFTRSGSYDWDHFIDVNGANKGLNNETLDPPAVSYANKPVAVLPNALGAFSVFEAGDDGLLRYKDQTYPGEDLSAKP